MERWWPDIGLEPVYFDDLVVLFHADVRDVLPRIPEKTIDHTVTDPPYEDASHKYGRLRDEKGRIALKDLSFTKIEESVGREWAARHFVRVTQGWILAFGETEAMGDWRKELEKAGALWARAQWWEKPDGAPQITGHKPGVPGETMATAWATARSVVQAIVPSPGKGIATAWGAPGTRSEWNGGGLRGFYSVPVRDGTQRMHETEKPLPLMLTLIDRFTKRGQLIGDWFAGSGTTGAACKMRGRRCILVEREEKWVKQAIKRLQTTKEQSLLFGDEAMINQKGKQSTISVDGVDLRAKKKPRALI